MTSLWIVISPSKCFIWSCASRKASISREISSGGVIVSPAGVVSDFVLRVLKGSTFLAAACGLVEALAMCPSRYNPIVAKLDKLELSQAGGDIHLTLEHR